MNRYDRVMGMVQMLLCGAVAFGLGFMVGVLFYRDHVLQKFREYQEEKGSITYFYPDYLESNAEKAAGQFYVDYYNGTNAILDDCTECVEVVEATNETQMAAELEITDDIVLMAKCIEAEAGNQGLLGKQLVADVILNRVISSEFPNTITEVIKQKSQFATWSNGMIDRAEPTAETYDAIATEMASIQNTEILYFTAGDYGRYGTPLMQVGDHYFCAK